VNPLTVHALAHRPDATAMIFSGRQWSWRALDQSSARIAAHLAALGVQPGARIAVLAHNAPGVILLVHAAARLGATLVLLNTRLTVADWREQVQRADCMLGVLGPGFTDMGLQIPELTLDALDLEAPPREDADPDPARPLALLYTSGTTGRPKGALLSLGALMAQARNTAAHLGSRPDDVHLCNLPLFHIGGLAMLFRTAESGSTLLLHERFDAAAVVRDLAEQQVSHLSLVATTLARVLEHAGPGVVRAPKLRVLPVGGGPLPAPLRRRAEAAGLQPLGTYGLTEACSQVTTVPPSERSEAGASSGRALPGMQVRIVDAQRAPLPPGCAGEIEVRGTSLMLGYDGDPEATTATLADGWLRTRDLGTLDASGWLTVHARRTDLILSGGENVYPAEIEAALLGIAGVRDAGVIGRDDATWGQVPVAGVVLDAGVSLEEIRRALLPQLARYKQPRDLVALPELPRNAAGKLDRQRLRALLLR
jgi:O-succinylbenzoic acid--CoA ligase